MPRRTIASQSEFIASLSDEQRRWYLAECAGREQQLRGALDALCRGLGTVAGLHGEALEMRLRQAPDPPSSRADRRRG